MADTQTSYECPHHKVEVQGEKRDTFQKEYYDALMVVDMMTSMKLYKYVNVACHCSSNYEAFDRIIKDTKEPTAPKDPELPTN
jgi:hypothetical protein